MDFADIRAKFIDISGRSDFADRAGDGSEFFIKAGHRFLERLISSPRVICDDSVNTVASTDNIITDDYRAIKEVWIKDATLGDNPWVKLDNITYSEYLNIKSDSSDEGLPKYWTQYTTDQQDQTNTEKLGVILHPTPDAVYSVKILAMCSEDFNDYSETGVTYWSEMYPELVVLASLYQLEIFYRNTEGAKDWLGAIQLTIKGIDFDNVEQELADVNTMRDSYALARGWENLNNIIVNR